MAPSARASAFLAHVEQSGYICTIGSAMARQGRLPLFEMPEAVDGRMTVARDAVRALLEFGRGAAVGVIYPEEPADYEGLQAMHANVHANVFAACVAESAMAANHRGKFPLPRPGKYVPAPLLPTLAQAVRQKDQAPFVAYEGTRVIQDMVLAVGSDPYASFNGIRDASAALLTADPNIAPGVDGHVLQAIVLSPQFTGDSSDEIRALLAEVGLPDVPHGRYAPVTAMVLNYHADVMEAIQSKLGRAIRQRMNLGASITRYRSMDVLAEKPDAAKRHQQLQQALAGRNEGANA